MKKPLAIVAMVLVTVLLLVLAAVGIILATFNPNDYKENISAAIYKATGRQVLLQGDMAVTFYPWVGLKTGKFLVSDPPAFGPEPFVSAESASLRLAFMPLLSGKVEVKEILLDGVRLKLVETTTGQKNWELVKPVAEGTAAKATDADVAPLEDSSKALEGKDSGKPMDLSVESLRCKDFQVVYRNLAEGASYRLTVDSLELENLRPNADMPLSLTGSMADENKGLTADVTIKAVLRLTAGGDISGTIETCDVEAKKGKASLKTGLSTRFAFSPATRVVSLDDLKGTLHDTAFSGAVAVTLPGAGAPGLGIKGALAVEPLNLDALLDAIAPMTAESGKASGVVSGAPNMGNETVAGKKAPEGPQRVEAGDAGLSPALKNLDADFKLTMKSLSVAKMTLTGLNVHVQAENGKVKAPYSFTLYSGAISGTATANLSQTVPSVGLSNEVKGLAVGEMLQGMTGKQNLSGTLVSSLAVSGQGLDWKKLAPSLSGKGNVVITNGEVKGFTLIPPGLPNVAPVPVNFALTRISDSFTISKGVLSTSDFLLDSPTITGNGGGTVNLVTQGLALTIKFLLAGQPPAIPVLISGSMSAPSYTVDVAELAKGAAMDVLQSPEHVQELIKDPKKILETPGGTGDVIRGVEGLFKKK